MYELYDGHELERDSLVVHLRHQAVDSSSRERALPEPELVQHRFARREET
jgi:hypothetical protein